ncbi:MAG: V-type ATP synthase subunit I [Clostridiales bacterium]|uniref:V/A-type H+-transporting ATPase subunit I n=1 Tax=Harryflintia acetispora TaxID=1849041 RepID=A0A9X8UHY7_9FIRM|nr:MULTISPECIES: V-type ATPase 116kDa subunit family protein [Oscillospiraceae]PWM34832.1 MAG: V-type ATP synthase subunit I [Clostridiales bacterium]RGB66090.1 V-type ATP synthase subunit I [Harryflintia acetispora]TCL42716.1 V/A-type H+-transporting ATPase subunit I [Harryflintia acetispora]
MAIEKMDLVNIKGPLNKLDDTILKCSDLGCFHPKNITPASLAGSKFEELEYKNPYQKLLSRMVTLAGDAGIELKYGDIENLVVDRQEVKAFVSEFSERFLTLQAQRGELQKNIEQHRNALIHLRHLEGMEVSFDKIFSNQYIKVRFGRLPLDSNRKLSYYNHKMFFFFPFDKDESYLWGVYFTTNEYAQEVDDIFSALFFERVRIPDYVHGTPQLAIDLLETQYKDETQKFDTVQKQIETLVSENKARFLDYYRQVRFLCSTFDLRKYVGVANGMFYMVGFIPKGNEKRFSETLRAIDGLTVDLMPEDNDKRFQAPTKLKNNWFVRPFEMFVKMYGIPSHKDIDPTPYVAIVYTLLFGVMFGDLGQGLLLSLAGALMWRFKKMELGPIVTRIGFSSAFFGLLYGSVFGFEHALDPLYHALGFSGKPIEVMDAGTINMLLIGAVGIGALIIMVSILINIVLGFKQHDMDRAIFSQNGLAGLVFYGTVLCGVLGMLTGTSVLNPVVIALGIVLPILLIFFKEPLGKLARGERKISFESGVGSFIAESFFELFEVVLSFVANTMSFLRVGGFILSHAGMMAVVFTISSMVSAGASPVVIVIGNLFVMCLEGLIVGIQVLRLQFYEMFSRFFSGEGEPFEPISVDMAAVQ